MVAINEQWFWFFAAGMGILFGILAAALWAESMCSQAVAQCRAVPHWMLSQLGINPDAEPGSGLLPPRYAGPLKRGLSACLMVIILIVFHYLFWQGVPVNMTNLIRIESSFPLAALLSWLVPVAVLSRYLKRLRGATTNPNGSIDVA